MVGSDVFPIDIVPLKRGHVSFPGCIPTFQQIFPIPKSVPRFPSPAPAPKTEVAAELTLPPRRPGFPMGAELERLGQIFSGENGESLLMTYQLGPGGGFRSKVSGGYPCVIRVYSSNWLIGITHQKNGLIFRTWKIQPAIFEIDLAFKLELPTISW